MSKYKIYVWPGIGYVCDTFFVDANSEEEAFEKLSAEIIDKGLFGLFITPEEYDKLFADELSEDENYESDQYLYIDGTMEGAKYPIYLNAENLGIEKVA